MDVMGKKRVIENKTGQKEALNENTGEIIKLLISKTVGETIETCKLKFKN
jgi:hypothetical protein